MKAFRLAVAMAIVAVPLTLVGCGSVSKDVAGGATDAQGPLAAGCASLVALTGVAGMVPGVSKIMPYVSAACQTAQGFAKMLADPSSLEWVGQLEGKVQELAKTATF
jgi:hypothetical protein